MNGRTVLVALVGVLIGAAVGVGGFTFIFARGSSYLTNDPRACANCHVMHEQYSGWIQSSHRNVAVCNDCHAPHDLAGKLATKAVNGFFHSSAFTTGRFPDVIHITERNRRITEQACRHCHERLAAEIDGPHRGRGTLPCLGCHNGVGHWELPTLGTLPPEDR